jgi:hypothetical protein
MKNYLIILLICVNSANLLWAQELNANVRVTAPNLGLSDKSIVRQLEQSVKDFLNSQKWTQDVYEPNERIKCNFQLTISADRGDNNLLIDLSVQAVRPVFNSSYETTLINLNDKQIPIHFDPYKNLENSKETYYDNLSSVLTFYAYYILALDYDSFSLEGGTTYLQILDNMINALPSNVKTGDDAWSAAKDKRNNRYFLVENLLNPRMKVFRRAFYEYHRLAMDLISKDATNARSTLAGVIEDIGRANASYPETYLIKVFSLAKKDEIIEIFKQGNAQEKQRVYQTMTQLDPANTSAYNVIKT